MSNVILKTHLVSVEKKHAGDIIHTFILPVRTMTLNQINGLQKQI